VVDFLFILNFLSMEDKNLFNRKEIKLLRSSLRNKGTSAEVALWNLLKSKQLCGKKFRRQHSIGRYIVDFCCPSEKIIVEVDGSYHGEVQRIKKDEERDEYLQSLGFTVIRFENRQVFQDPDFVRDEIRKAMGEEGS
jgi:very-short-patch-repair endonuclease